MIQLTPQHRILLYSKAVDFRKGIDGLVGLCRFRLKEDPFLGTVFAFTNRSHTAVKLLVYDGNGFWLMHKRFSKGRLKNWPTQPGQNICALSMMTLLNQGAFSETAPEPWRALPVFKDNKVS